MPQRPGGEGCYVAKGTHFRAPFGRQLLTLGNEKGPLGREGGGMGWGGGRTRTEETDPVTACLRDKLVGTMALPCLPSCVATTTLPMLPRGGGGSAPWLPLVSLRVGGGGESLKAKRVVGLPTRWNALWAPLWVPPTSPKLVRGG